jgi:hypothetical protein
MEFNAMHRIQEERVYMECRECGWPQVTTGRKARVISKALKGLEEMKQPESTREFLLGLAKEYRAKANKDEVYQSAITAIYQLLYAEDEIDLNWLRKSYAETRKVNVPACIQDMDDRAYMERRKELKLEVLKRLASTL